MRRRQVVTLASSLLPLSQPRSRPFAVLLDEDDAGGFKGTAHSIKGGRVRVRRAAFKILDGQVRHARGLHQIELPPIEQSPGGPNLCRHDHLQRCFAFLSFTPGSPPFVNSTPAASRARWMAASVPAFAPDSEPSSLSSRL